MEGSAWRIYRLSDFSTYPEPDETEDSLAGNALIKARAGFSHTGLLTLADDTGLEIDALGSKPGVYSSRFAGPDCSYQDNVDKVLLEMRGIPWEKRTARFKCVMALVDDEKEIWWEGCVDGYITEHPRGTGGFGYDPIFYLPELDVTFAEVSVEVKNRHSHRGRALAQLISHLRQIDEK